MTTQISRRGDAWFRALIEHSTDAIVLLDTSGTIIYASPSTERVTGYSADEIVGQSSYALVHPEDLEGMVRQTACLGDKPGDFITFEYRQRQKDGSWGWMEATATNLMNDPAVGAVVGNYRDITERKLAEERLQQSEERYRVLVEQASDGIFLADQQGVFLDVNPSGCALLACSREELLGTCIDNWICEEDRPAMQASLGPLLAGQPILTQWCFKRRNGDIIPMEVSAKLLSNGHFQGIARDISARIQAEEERARLLALEQAARVEAEVARTKAEELVRQLEIEKEALSQAERQAEQRASQLIAIFESITDGVIVCDREGLIQYSNAAFRTIYALDRSDAVPPHSVFHERGTWGLPLDLEGNPLPREEWPISRVLRGERLSGSRSVDLRVSPSRGEDLFLNESGAPICSVPSQIIGGVIVIRDVTKRRRLEQQLRYSEQKLRALVDSNIVGVMVGNLQGQILEVNERLVQMLGYSREELLSGDLTWLQLIATEYHEELKKAMPGLVAKGAALPWEKEFLRKDGSRVPVMAGTAMIDREQSLTLTMLLDISDRKEADRRKQEFLSMVSHELRTPLTAIQGLVELALLYMERHAKAGPGERETDPLHKIETVLQRAARQIEVETRLVEALLDMSRMEMNIFELELSYCDLKAIVQESVANQQQAAAALMRNIELMLPEETVPVIVDAGRIGQVLTNYLTNALKFSPAEQPVQVSLEVDAGLTRVAVHDHGSGLTAEQQQRIWERFYQAGVSSAHQGSEGGLGLGLAISQTIVQQHQGQVGVESCPGRGSTFWFTLPLADDRMQVERS